ncbi:MAG: RNA polymerase sigma factor [Saprospiraceae bacterium]|nr:RNA polymerase sigma factor [Saprospiraceae bacterium]
MCELELVKKCLQGDQKSCKQLYDEFAPTMLGICHRYLTRTAEAEDALQDGFIKVFQNLNSWKQTGALGAWIRRIIVNPCLTQLHTKSKLIEIGPEELFPDVSIEPEVLYSLDYEAFENILKSMPAGYRAVFNLAVIEGYSYEEISKLLQVKEVSCRSQLYKAKQFLAKRLQTLYPHLKLPA